MSDYISLRNLFNEYKCMLPNQEPIDLDSIHFRCSCNRETTTSLDEFKDMHHCESCNGCAKNTKLTHAFVSQQFDIHGCILRSTEYKGRDAKLEYECKCGEIDTVTYAVFVISPHKRCASCLADMRFGAPPLDYETVKQTYIDADCELTTKEYHNQEDVMEFICSCGRRDEKPYLLFRRSPWCRKCGYESKANSRRLSFDVVNEYFDAQRCTLTSKSYDGYHSKLEYICVCGRIGNTSFAKFKEGTRCGGCRNSIGESRTRDVLDGLYVLYKPNYTDVGCIDKKKLSFDFYVTYANRTALIEFGGIQHFKAVERFGGDPQFQTQRRHDRIKNQFAIDNRIPILHISYKEIKNIKLILSIYFQLLENDLAPPILFTNKDLYQDMYAQINHPIKTSSYLEKLLTDNDLHLDANTISSRNPFLIIR